MKTASHACLAFAGLVGLSSLALACGAKKPPPPPPPPPPKVEPVATTPPPEPPPKVDPPPKLTMPEMQKKTLLAATNLHEAVKVQPLYAPDAVKRAPSAEGWKEIKGAEVIAKQSEELHAKAGPGLAWALVRVIQKNEFTISEYVVSGTRESKKIGVRGVAIQAFDDEGRIKREDIYLDQPTMMIQSGRIAGKSEPVATPSGEPQWIVAKNDAGEEKNEKLLKTSWPTAWQKKDKKAFEAILADDYTQDDVAWNISFKSKAEASKGMASFTKAVPDIAITVDETWAAGDVVVAAMTMKGTQKGALGPVKATHKPFTAHLVNVADVKGEKLGKSTVYMNSIEMLGQLGVAPKPDEKPAGDKPDKPKK